MVETSCLILGFLLYVVAHVWFAVVAFRMSMGAGFACLFLGCFFHVAMVVMNPKESWKPLAVGIAGVAIGMFGLSTLDGLNADYAPEERYRSSDPVIRAIEDESRRQLEADVQRLIYEDQDESVETLD